MANESREQQQASVQKIIELVEAVEKLPTG